MLYSLDMLQSVYKPPPSCAANEAIFLRIEPLIVRELLTKNGHKFIYSLTYSTSQVYILKLQLKPNCLFGLAVMVLFACVATASCKLQIMKYVSLAITFVISSHEHT